MIEVIFDSIPNAIVTALVVTILILMVYGISEPIYNDVQRKKRLKNRKKK